MSLGGVCFDMSQELRVVGPGEIDPAVRWVYAVEATHLPLPSSGPDPLSGRIGEKDDTKRRRLVS